MPLSEQQVQTFKERLEAEKKELEADLQTLGRINPDNPKDWEAVQDDLNILQTDSNEVADVFEEYEQNTAVLKELETRLLEVNHALKKINNESDHGQYGIGEVSGKEIPVARLETNPAARDSVEHEDGLESLHVE